MKKFLRKIKNESGQAMVIVALSVVVLVGATAMSVDLGMAYKVKAELQAAVDAAALAGAQELPKPFDSAQESAIANEEAKKIAIYYADRNGVQIKPEQVVPGYGGNRRLIEVTGTQQHEYFFARILGFDATTIKVRAVAELRFGWGGQTLPFVNIDDDYTKDSQIVLWEKTEAGDFELLSNLNPPSYEFISEGKGNARTTTGCMLVGFENGTLDLRNGLNSGIENDINSLLDLWSQGEFIYVLSLETIPSEPVNYIHGVDNKLNDGKDSVTLDLGEIVLLKCTINMDNTFTKASANNRGISLTIIDSTPIDLEAALLGEDKIPGFVNYGATVGLVE